MNKAATQDATGVLVWPVIRAMLSRGHAPDAQTASAVALIDNWVRHGAPTVGNPPGGPIPYAGAALLGAAWPHIFDAVMRPRLGSVLGAFENLLGRDPSYVDKDLKTELGRHVLAPYSVRYCGRGNVPACARSLWSAIKAGQADLVKQNGAERIVLADRPGSDRASCPASSRPCSRPRTGRRTNRSSRWRRDPSPHASGSFWRESSLQRSEQVGVGRLDIDSVRGEQPLEGDAPPG